MVRSHKNRQRFVYSMQRLSLHLQIYLTHKKTEALKGLLFLDLHLSDVDLNAGSARYNDQHFYASSSLEAYDADLPCESNHDESGDL